MPEKIYKLFIMDIFNSLSVIVVFLPLIFAISMLIARVKFVLINKTILNYGLYLINIINLILVSISAYFIYVQNKTFNFSLNCFDFSFNLLADKNNILFLITASIFYFLVNVFVIRFFITKKQFLFTKQRYYILFSLLISNTYLFLCSPNILQCLVFWFVQSLIILIFSYFDIFKISTKVNITRFLRINLLGDFAFLVAYVLFFKYAILQEPLIESTSIAIKNINLFFSYLIGISSIGEYKFALIMLLIAVFSRLIIFPFSCYYSFFANSSSVLYLPIMVCANNILGAYLYLNICPMFDYFPNAKMFIYTISLITIITSLMFITYEKNIKIIYGYLLSIINAVFISLVLFNKYSVFIYFGLLFVLLLILMNLFSKDKNNIKRKVLNKFTGFYLEKFNIFVFEKVPYKLANILTLVNKYFFKILFGLGNKITDTANTFFVIKSSKASKITIIRTVFLVFTLFVVFIILAILFRRIDFG